MTFQRVEVKNVDLLVWPIAEKQLVAAILHVNFGDSETDMLRHLVDELHLDRTSDLLTLVAQDKLCDLLVPHVCRSVNLRAELFDFAYALRL